VSARTIARRYGAALFDVAVRADAIDRVERDLADLVQTISGHADLAAVLASAAIPVPIKREIVAKLLQTAPDLSPHVARLIELLADRDRLGMLGEVASAFQHRLMDMRRVMSAEIVSAVPLSSDGRASLSAALGRATARQVTMTERVDPSLMGGLVARLGGTVFDASLVRQLERLHEQLREQV
jgi:F-type H+-transporting ATPase subunit delta